MTRIHRAIAALRSRIAPGRMLRKRSDPVSPLCPLPQNSTRRPRIWLVGALSFAAGMFSLAGIQYYVTHSTLPYLFTAVGQVPSRPVAIVFGARVYPGGMLSTVLKARVDAGIGLYRAGKVKKLLMTGDNSSRHYDEVTAMKRYAVSHGVPANDIVRDFAGFRTFDSCYRARDVFQVREAVLVTQAYHLPRALFLARSLGIDAVGLAAAPGVDDRTLERFQLRESLATAMAFLDAVLPFRRPHFLGPTEPIFGSSQPDR